MTTINNKHVLITGAASGLGRLLALRCAGLGATVTIWDLDAAGGEAVAAEATALGPGRARAFACDVSDRAQVYARAAEVLAHAGAVDILVNNAGVVSGRELLELDDERIERTFAVNALALFWVTKAFLPAMVAGGSGHVVTVASAARPHRLAADDRLRGEQVRRRGLQRGAAPRAQAQRPGRQDDGRLPVLHRHRHVRRGQDALPAPPADPAARRTSSERIVKAIQHDRPQVVMPWMVRTLPAMRLLPVGAFDRLADFFGITAAMDEFTGREGAAGVS